MPYDEPFTLFSLKRTTCGQDTGLWGITSKFSGCSISIFVPNSFLKDIRDVKPFYVWSSGICGRGLGSMREKLDLGKLWTLRKILNAVDEQPGIEQCSTIWDIAIHSLANVKIWPSAASGCYIQQHLNPNFTTNNLVMDEVIFICYGIHNFRNTHY